MAFKVVGCSNRISGNIEIKISRLKIPSICDFDEINFTLTGDFIVKVSKKNIIFGF